MRIFRRFYARRVIKSAALAAFLLAIVLVSADTGKARDSCDLVTREDVEIVLGRPVTQVVPGEKICTYLSDGPVFTATLREYDSKTQAIHGMAADFSRLWSEGKTVTFLGEGALGFRALGPRSIELFALDETRVIELAVVEDAIDPARYEQRIVALLMKALPFRKPLTPGISDRFLVPLLGSDTHKARYSCDLVTQEEAAKVLGQSVTGVVSSDGVCTYLSDGVVLVAAMNDYYSEDRARNRMALDRKRREHEGKTVTNAGGFERAVSQKSVEFSVLDGTRVIDLAVAGDKIDPARHETRLISLLTTLTTGRHRARP